MGRVWFALDFSLRTDLDRTHAILMNSRPLQIRVISDSRPGHENQSVGLAEAIGRRVPVELRILRVPATFFLPTRVRAVMNQLRADPSGVDLFIGVGHSVHLPLWWAARSLQARSVVILDPTWPRSLFDLCLIPRHDLGPTPASAHLVPTLGALNRLPEAPQPKAAAGLVLIGGPSRHHGWDGASLQSALGEIVARNPRLRWTLADSRRTPSGFLAGLGDGSSNAVLMPHQATTPGWLPGQLMVAEEVWVTEDSVSMAYEAVTSRARVGLLPIPRLAKRSRVYSAIDLLAAERLATPFERWRQNGELAPPARLIHEAGRCAEEVLRRFFPDRARVTNAFETLARTTS